MFGDWNQRTLLLFLGGHGRPLQPRRREGKIKWGRGCTCGAYLACEADQSLSRRDYPLDRGSLAGRPISVPKGLPVGARLACEADQSLRRSVSPRVPSSFVVLHYGEQVGTKSFAPYGKTVPRDLSSVPRTCSVLEQGDTVGLSVCAALSQETLVTANERSP